MSECRHEISSPPRRHACRSSSHPLNNARGQRSIRWHHFTNRSACRSSRNAEGAQQGRSRMGNAQSFLQNNVRSAAPHCGHRGFARMFKKPELATATESDIDAWSPRSCDRPCLRSSRRRSSSTATAARASSAAGSTLKHHRLELPACRAAKSTSKRRLHRIASRRQLTGQGVLRARSPMLLATDQKMKERKNSSRSHTSRHPFSASVPSRSSRAARSKTAAPINRRTMRLGLRPRSLPTWCRFPAPSPSHAPISPNRSCTQGSPAGDTETAAACRRFVS
jgi:hypothetical protein